MPLVSGLGLPPPGLDLAQDNRPTIIAVSVITWTLAFLAVAMRLACRQMKGVRLWWDDWLILASLVPSFALVAGLAGYAVHRGFGRHVWIAPPDAIYALTLGVFIAELGYFVTLACVKWSILAFYWRSFHVRQSIKVPIWILAVVVGLWGLAVFLVTLLQCQPIHAWWDRYDINNPLPPSEYHCDVNPRRFFYGNAIPTIVTNILMLALPVPYIWNLQLPVGQKLALVAIFLVGIFVTVVSVVRLHYLLQSDIKDADITWNFTNMGLWTIVEANIAIVCACLPFLRLIVQKLTNSRHQESSASTTLQSSFHNHHHHHHHHKDPWDGGEGGRFPARSSVHVRAYFAGETDEHPFAHLTDDERLNQGQPIKRNESGSIELEGVSRGKTTDGILVTREVYLQHQTKPA
ncbi:Uncharacterized protein TCAP_06229 [Tolypocladium capitatum]|uniref:Rhodopsin domain-containing protein n=1 Tax=Tolypocladium capitatum TaxID=45235 RepID=A0A2K3Q8H4_9HYPO|nr:Uncharacterized protein TCAP_06229 [Tolypocladium capitatum]